MALFNIVPLYYVFGAFERGKIDYQTEEKKTERKRTNLCDCDRQTFQCRDAG